MELSGVCWDGKSRPICDWEDKASMGFGWWDIRDTQNMRS